jgi:hypothetical protein
MKKFDTRIFIVSTAPMTDEEIKIIEGYLPNQYHNRIKYHDWERDSQTGYIDLLSNSDSDLDEPSIFILNLDDAGVDTFWGVPLEDYSNNTENYELIHLADIIK